MRGPLPAGRRGTSPVDRTARRRPRWHSSRRGGADPRCRLRYDVEPVPFVFERVRGQRTPALAFMAEASPPRLRRPRAATWCRVPGGGWRRRGSVGLGARGRLRRRGWSAGQDGSGRSRQGSTRAHLEEDRGLGVLEERFELVGEPNGLSEVEAPVARIGRVSGVIQPPVKLER